MKCPICDNVIEEDETTCDLCGNDLSEYDPYEALGNKNNYYTQHNQKQDQKQTIYKPIKQKSKAIAFILSFLVVGLGYCYLDEWKKGIIFFLIAVICTLLSFLIIPSIIVFILWIYTLYNILDETDQYNKGELQ